MRYINIVYNNNNKMSLHNKWDCSYMLIYNFKYMKDTTANKWLLIQIAAKDIF